MSLAQVLPVLGCLDLVLTKLLSWVWTSWGYTYISTHTPCPPCTHTHTPRNILLRPSWEMDTGHGGIWSRKQWAAHSTTTYLTAVWLNPHHTTDCGEGSYLVTSSWALINTQESGNQLMTQRLLRSSSPGKLHLTIAIFPFSNTAQFFCCY